ncbi:MAG: DUF1697 domain-containing protein [Candidatus Acidiferrales bacterium]
MTSYVAFLRGINVGGNKKMSMAGLREALAADGFRNVRTLLASGNVLFEAEGAGAAHAAKLAQRIERQIAKALAMEVAVVLRTRRELQRLIESDPFQGIRVTPLTRLFVTFLAEKPKTALRIPYLSPDKSYKILSLAGRDVCSVLTLGPQWSKNLRQMDILEKEFGKRITTRSWSTVRKCCDV